MYAYTVYRHHLGTQTPYWSQGSTTPSPVPVTCSLRHVDLVSRHGARNPTNGDIKSLAALAKTVQNYSAYINDSYSWIKNWKSPYLSAEQGYLSYSGQVMMYNMGMRYNYTYYPLFAQPYTPAVYVIQSTQVPRTGMSASSFSQGYLQGRGLIGPTDYQPPYIFSDTPADDVLRFFDNCPQYTAAQDNGTISNSEYTQYTNRVYPGIAAKVMQLLGVSQYWQISNDQLDTMFTACAFEVAVYNKSDGCVSVFIDKPLNLFLVGAQYFPMTTFQFTSTRVTWIITG
jgi:hypothetical protein